jgi:hypothetical protein
MASRHAALPRLASFRIERPFGDVDLGDDVRRIGEVPLGVDLAQPVELSIDVRPGIRQAEHEARERPQCGGKRHLAPFSQLLSEGLQLFAPRKGGVGVPALEVQHHEPAQALVCEPMIGETLCRPPPFFEQTFGGVVVAALVFDQAAAHRDVGQLHLDGRRQVGGLLEGASAEEFPFRLSEAATLAIARAGWRVGVPRGALR